MSELCGVRRYKNGVWEEFDDRVSREEAFYVTWSGPHAGSEKRVRLWAWPGPDSQGLRDLALGHVLLECVPGELTHSVLGTVTDAPDGFCVQLAFAETAPPLHIPDLEPDCVLGRMDAFMGLKGLWDGTGCFHRAGFWLPCPQDANPVLQVAEDIGRHNCLDRLMGYAATHRVSLRGQVLFVTARITASLYTKASRMGFGAIVSRSAVSLHAVQAAQRDKVRLMGFCRPKEARFTVYA